MHPYDYYPNARKQENLIQNKTHAHYREREISLLNFSSGSELSPRKTDDIKRVESVCLDRIVL